LTFVLGSNANSGDVEDFAIGLLNLSFAKLRHEVGRGLQIDDKIVSPPLSLSKAGDASCANSEQPACEVET
jgi:hypothetical protein